MNDWIAKKNKALGPQAGKSKSGTASTWITKKLKKTPQWITKKPKKPKKTPQWITKKPKKKN